MYQIRKGVFETNSSSTHSICISKDAIDYDNLPYVDFHIGDYGWEEDEYDVKDYLYTAILTQPEEKRREYMDKLIATLNNYGVKYEFEPAKFEIGVYNGAPYNYLDYDCGYIDHSGELDDFLNAVFSDEDLLMRCIFGDGVVYTGNDNSSYDYDDYPMCDVAHDHRWVKTGKGDDWEKDWEYKFIGNYEHPEYNPDKYDYFYKGN